MKSGKSSDMCKQMLFEEYTKTQPRRQGRSRCKTNFVHRFRFIF